MSNNSSLPAIHFLGHDTWKHIVWQGTTFRWHPSSAAPPVMGLVFGDKGMTATLFNSWISLSGNQDPFEELRVTIIDGELPGTVPGYIVHLCPDPENTMAHATAEDIIIDSQCCEQYCRANKMDYLPDSPPMLARFKEEYEKHKEFLLAPVTKHEDGQFYVDVELGIIKREIHFIKAQDIAAELKAKGIDLELLQALLAEQTNNPPQLP